MPKYIQNNRHSEKLGETYFRSALLPDLKADRGCGATFHDREPPETALIILCDA